MVARELQSWRGARERLTYRGAQGWGINPYRNWLGKGEGSNFMNSGNHLDLKSRIGARGHCVTPGVKAGKQHMDIQSGISDLKSAETHSGEVIFSFQSMSRRGSIHGEKPLGTKELAGAISLLCPSV